MLHYRVPLVQLSILLCYLSLPGGVLPSAAVVCLVPLGLALRDAPPRLAFALAYGCGFFGWLTATTGLATGVSLYLQLSFAHALVYIAAFCAYQALPYGLFGLLYGRYQWTALPAAACLTVLVSLFPTPLPVGPAHSLYVFPSAIQVLDLGGIPLLLFVLCLVSWLLVDVISRRRSSVVPLLSIVAAVLAYGQFRLAQFHRDERGLDRVRTIRMAAIQPDLPLGSEEAESLETLVAMSEQALSANPQVELVVWPETPGRLDCGRDSRSRDQLMQFVARRHTPLLVDCVQTAAGGGDVNTALLVSPGGNVREYGKQMLFPFAEYVPGEKTWPSIRRLTERASRYVPGSDETLFDLTKKVTGIAVICYEVLFPGHVVPFVARGGNMLINPSDDAWFGRSRIPEFLIAAGVLQATAFRVPLVRVSNSGGSLFVKASGEFAPDSRTANLTGTTLVSTVFIPADRSPYARLPNAFLYMMALGCGAAFFRRKRS